MKNIIVIYRTGGEINFKWNASVSDTYENSVSRAAKVRRAGRPAFLATLAQLKKIGLPVSLMADEYFSI